MSPKMFKIIDLKQNTPEWHEWRRTRITASDIPALFDASPYKSAKKLFEEKLGLHEEKVSKYKQQLFDKGHLAERLGREYLNKTYASPFVPVVVESLEIKGLGASLDGINEPLGLIAEFKYMGRKALDGVLHELIKEHHVIQVQTQLFASQSKSCIYFAMDGESHCARDIARDETLIKEIKIRAKEFLAELRNFNEKI